MIKRNLLLYLILCIVLSGVCPAASKGENDIYPAFGSVPYGIAPAGDLAVEEKHRAYAVYPAQDGGFIEAEREFSCTEDGLLRAVLNELSIAPFGVGALAACPEGCRVTLALNEGGHALVNLKTVSDMDPEALLLYARCALRTLKQQGDAQGLTLLVNGSVPETPVRLTGEGTVNTSDAVLYCPAAGGKYVCPVTVSLPETEMSEADRLISLLGSAEGEGLAAFPVGAASLLRESKTVYLAGTGRVLDICFREETVADIDASGVERAQFLASLVLTLTTNLPGVSGIIVRFGENNRVTAVPYRGGGNLAFPDGVIRLTDFIADAGECIRVYKPDGAGKLTSFIAPSASKPSARLLNRARECVCALGFRSIDVLGVKKSEGIAYVNLSPAFYAAVQSLNGEDEMTAVYALVNSLCLESGVREALLLFEGKAAAVFSDRIRLDGPLLPNPGLIASNE